MLPKGTTVAGYRIDGTLGEGGMGIVYRATQLSLNRSVALKILSADLGDDPGFRERFRREGLLQAAIDHSHIVTVYDTGESEHGLYLVMRMVRGPTLKDMILGRELDPGRSLRLLSQVADALDTAHEVGLTHRDIKPQNILIGSRDHAYLADFGLTKAPDEAGRLTATGQFVGTIDYVSPEQIQGEPATGRSDIYALTGVIYECLVGRVPYPKPAEAAVVYAHIAEPPPRPTQDRPELPEAIDAVIAKGMAKSPEDRPATAGELLRDAHGAFGEAVGTTPRPLAAPEETGVRGNGAPTRPAGASPTLPASPPGGVTATSPVYAAPTAPASGRPAAAPTAPASGKPAPAGATAPAAGPASATPGAATAPAKAPSRSGPAPLLAVAGALAVASAVAGFLLGGSGSGSERAELTNSVSAGSLGLSFPSGWRRVTEEPDIPGLSFSDPIVLALPGNRNARLIAGTVEGAGPSLLPQSFLARLPSQPPRDDTVRLGRLQAYRYAGLLPRGASERITLFAAPTSGGVAALACRPQAPAAADCERVATTLELSGARPLALGPREDYARAVGATQRRLGAVAGPAARRLRGVRTAAAQAGAATELGDAYRGAERSLSRAPAGPLERDAHSRLATSLRGLASAYARVAGAARRGDGGAYATASREVRRAGTGLTRAQDALRKLGYAVE